MIFTKYKKYSGRIGSEIRTTSRSSSERSEPFRCSGGQSRRIGRDGSSPSDQRDLVRQPSQLLATLPHGGRGNCADVPASYLDSGRTVRGKSRAGRHFHFPASATETSAGHQLCGRRLNEIGKGPLIDVANVETVLEIPGFRGCASRKVSLPFILSSIFSPWWTLDICWCCRANSPTID